MKTRALILTFLLGLGLFGWDGLRAQQDACKAELLEVLGKIQEAQAAGGTYRVVFRLQAVPKDSLELDRVERKITMASNRTQILYESAEMSVYADQDMVANVVHAEKMLYVSSQGLGAFPQADPNAGSLSLLDKEYLSGTEVQRCGPAMERGCSSCRQLSLKVTRGPLQSQGIQRLSYVYDTQTMTLKRLRIDYVPQMEDAYAVLSFEKMEFNSATPALGRRVRDMIYAGGRVAPAYAGYKLIKTDQR